MRSFGKLSLEQKHRYYGLLFIFPWFIGFLFLFFIPMVHSLRYSLSDLKVNDAGFSMNFIGLSNYENVLFKHESYVRILTESIIDMAVNVPLIVVFSLISAVLLNQKFRGRTLARMIFFLPVILASGVIASIESGDFMQIVMKGASSESSDGSTLLNSFGLTKMLFESGMSPLIVEYLIGAVERIYQIITQSGVQILIFLAGLQSISPSLYEASKIEGATGYEAFWKITFPMLSPLILTNVVYSVIDNFISNKTSSLIRDTAFKSFQFGPSASMAWIYFVVIAVILWLTTVLISKKVFYYD